MVKTSEGYQLSKIRQAIVGTKIRNGRSLMKKAERLQKHKDEETAKDLLAVIKNYKEQE